MEWRFDNTWVRELSWLGAPTTPVPVSSPSLVALNEALADELGLDREALREGAAAWFSGNEAPPGAQPYSQAYAGHQFGGYSPLLGDGRAHLLGELLTPTGERRDLALKGSGRTPFSRGGDGRAVLGPVLREYLIGEAMHALGVPTTRVLAAVRTGEEVWRDGGPKPGAVLARVADSHLRVGTFQLVAAQGSTQQLRELLAYAIRRHYPELAPDDALGFLRAVTARQAELIAHWSSVGFIHGVMNTDNMTISGETIDYGPCAFLDAYDPQTVFSSIDTHGRYRFRAQPPIAAWNLARLAEALLPLIADVTGDADEAAKQATQVLHDFLRSYDAAWLRLHRAKLGLPAPEPSGEETGTAAAAAGTSVRAAADTSVRAAADTSVQDEEDTLLIQDLLALMHESRLDFTSTWRALAAALRGGALDLVGVHGLPADPQAVSAWTRRWRQRLELSDAMTGHPGSDWAAVAERMDAVNPLVIPRNHLVAEALTAAEGGDLEPFTELLAAVQAPYGPVGDERYARPAPVEWNDTFVTYCGT